MKTTGLKRVANDEILVIRKSFIDLCNGDKNAGILLSYFEYWHNIKVAQNIKSRGLNKVAETHGETPTQDTSLYQYHSTNEIYEQCLGMISMKGIKTGRETLVNLGFISEHKNPNPKYKFDKTIFFLLDTVKVNDSLSQNDCTVTSKRLDGIAKTTRAITETTTETTTEIKDKEIITTNKPLTLSQQIDEKYTDTTDYQRTVSMFDQERKKIQPNFVRMENMKLDGAYLLRKDCLENGRTLEMYLNAIRWLFSGDKAAEFFLGYVVNISKLIQHYNSIEMKYIANSKDSKMNESIKRAYEYYLSKGMTEDEALAEATK